MELVQRRLSRRNSEIASVAAAAAAQEGGAGAPPAVQQDVAVPAAVAVATAPVALPVLAPTAVPAAPAPADAVLRAEPSPDGLHASAEATHGVFSASPSAWSVDDDVGAAVVVSDGVVRPDAAASAWDAMGAAEPAPAGAFALPQQPTQSVGAMPAPAPAAAQDARLPQPVGSALVLAIAPAQASADPFVVIIPGDAGPPRGGDSEGAIRSLARAASESGPGSGGAVVGAWGSRSELGSRGSTPGGRGRVRATLIVGDDGAMVPVMAPPPQDGGGGAGRPVTAPLMVRPAWVIRFGVPIGSHVGELGSAPASSAPPLPLPLTEPEFWLGRRELVGLGFAACGGGTLTGDAPASAATVVGGGGGGSRGGGGRVLGLSDAQSVGQSVSGSVGSRSPSRSVVDASQARLLARVAPRADVYASMFAAMSGLLARAPLSPATPPSAAAKPAGGAIAVASTGVGVV